MKVQYRGVVKARLEWPSLSRSQDGSESVRRARSRLHDMNQLLNSDFNASRRELLTLPRTPCTLNAVVQAASCRTSDRGKREKAEVARIGVPMHSPFRTPRLCRTQIAPTYRSFIPPSRRTNRPFSTCSTHAGTLRSAAGPFRALRLRRLL